MGRHPVPVVTAATGRAAQAVVHDPADLGAYRASLVGPDLTGRLLDACDRSDLEALRELAGDPALREAVEIASPSLGGQLDRLLDGTLPRHRVRRLVEALYRYGVRLRYRPTPMGTFAGVGIVRLGAADGPGGDQPVPAGGGGVRRHARPSASWCAQLCARLTADDAAVLDLRLVASRSVYARRREIVALGPGLGGEEGGGADPGAGFAVSRQAPLVRAVLAACDGWRPGREVAALVQARTGCAPGEAVAFTAAMVRHGLLATELSAAVVGTDPFGEVADVVRARSADPRRTWAGWPEVARGVTEVRRALSALPPTAPAPVAAHRAVRAALEEVQSGADLHVDAVIREEAAAPNVPTNAVYAACRALALVSPLRDHAVVAGAARWFADRYSDAHTVRLSEMFLPGTGFDIAAPPPDPGARREPELFGGALDAYRLLDGRPEVDILPMLDRAELRGAASTLPAAFLALAEVAPATGAPRPVRLRNLSGGLQLLGRFGHLDGRVLEILRRFVAAEEAHDGDDTVRAEVRCPCLGRAQNIAVRPMLRRVCIDFGPPFDGADELGREVVSLPVDDLLVRLVDGRIRLYSERLGSRVIPCVSSAVVYHRCVYPAAAFLTILSGQETAGRQWNWQDLAGLRSLPRIVAGGVVLGARQWTLGRDDVSALRARAGTGTADGRSDLADVLPRYLSAGTAESPLTVDTRSRLGLDALARQIERARGSVQVKEAWAQPEGPDPDDVPVTVGVDGDPWTIDRAPAELVVPFTRRPAPVAPDRERTAAVAPVAAAGLAVRHAAPPRGPLPGFGPGSRWASVKVYGRSSTLDQLLLRLWPLIDAARTDGLVRRWFFVRYADPERHLRLRFTGRPHLLWGEFVPALWRALGQSDRTHDRVVVDEYRPEVDRFGGLRGLLLAERIFQADSDLVLRLRPTTDDARLAVGVVTTHVLLTSLRADTALRRDLVGRIERNRAAQHRRETARTEAGRRFRDGTDDLEAGMRGIWTADPADDPAGAWTADVMEASARLHALHGDDPARLDGIAASLVHMHSNRLFPEEANRWEVVTASLLRRIYDRQAHTGRTPAPVPVPTAVPTAVPGAG